MLIPPDAVLEHALAWIDSGRGAALATVVETWGSAPRPAGSLLAVSSEGDLMGSVSGGCVEGAVAVEAMEAMADGRCRMLEYGVSDADAFAVGLACGGTIRVWVEPVGVGEGPSLELLRDLAARRAARRPAVYLVDIATKARAALSPGEDHPLAEAARAAMTADKSRFAPESEVFLAVHNPPLRMAVVGAVHIAQALIPMAAAAGFDSTLIDVREAFASPARFPDTRIVIDSPEEGLATHGLDSRVAVVCLTHDPKLDDPALAAALGSEAFYIGALGSTRTAGKRRERLMAAGFAGAEIDRIHGPIGLDIGAQSPAEIAVSILAQIIAQLRRPDFAG